MKHPRFSLKLIGDVRSHQAHSNNHIKGSYSCKWLGQEERGPTYCKSEGWNTEQCAGNQAGSITVTLSSNTCVLISHQWVLQHQSMQNVEYMYCSLIPSHPSIAILSVRLHVQQILVSGCEQTWADAMWVLSSSTALTCMPSNQLV